MRRWNFRQVTSFDVTTALVVAAKNAGAPYHLGITDLQRHLLAGRERYDGFTGYVPRRFRGTVWEWQAGAGL